MVSCFGNREELSLYFEEISASKDYIEGLESTAFETKLRGLLPLYKENGTTANQAKNTSITNFA